MKVVRFESMPTSPLNIVIQHLLADLRPEGDGMTDGELLARFLGSRDEDALAALVRRHAPMVWGVCYRLLRNHHDAEDAFQATFLVLVRKAADVPGQAVANWLYGVARQTAVRLRAMAAKQGQRETQVLTMPEPTVAEVSDADVLGVLDEELSRLPDHYRGVIVLCDLEGMTRREAAQQLAIPEGSVASRLARARVMLAKRLNQRGVVLSGGSVATVLSAGAASSAPPGLVASTIKAANLLAAGRAAGVISMKVAALTEGMVKAMFVTKFKSVLAVVLVIGLTLGGIGAGVGHSSIPSAVAQQPGAKQDAATEPPPGKKEPPTRLVALCLLDSDGKRVAGVLSIDPVSGKYKALTDEASNRARVSPDGQTVIFNRDNAVWSADTGGSNNPGKVFDHKADPYGGPVWSRDGKHIYLSCITSKPGSLFWTHETWRYDADGGNPVKLKLPAGEAILDTSPGGKYFLTRSRGFPALNASALCLYDGEGKLVRRLSEPGKFNEPARFAPDGKRVAYCRGNDVLVVGVGGTGGEKVFGPNGVHVEDCCWSPDGKKLAVMACDYGTAGLIQTSEEARWRIEIVEVESKKSSELTVNWGGKLLRLYASVNWHAAPK